MFTSPWQKPFRGMQLNKAHPLARGLVGCWVMNEATGEKIFDLSGNGNHGTNNGVDWVAGGLNFNGTSDYIQTTSNELKTSDDFSVSIWFKADSTALSAIFWQGDILENMFGPGQEFHIGFGSIEAAPTANNIHICFIDDSIGVPTNYAGVYTAFSDTSSWHNIVGTIENNITAKLYLDGVYIGSDTAGDVVLKSDWDSNARIGRPGAELRWFNGCIANVMIYTHALTAEEVAWLHREPYAMFQQPISPASLYYEAPPGGVAPTAVFYGPLVGPLGGPL